MLSLKRQMLADELLEFTLNHYRSALLAIGRCGVQAVPAIGQNLQQSLEGIAAGLGPSVVSLERTANEVESELSAWGESAAQYYRAKTDEVREIMLSMARTTEAMGESDQRYAGQVQEFTARLESVADLEDLGQIRQWVVRSSAELRKAATDLAKSSREAVESLRAEVTRYETLLTESERRAEQDPLTGLFNRRGIGRELERRVSESRPFSVVMFDLNDFKSINDNFGHLAGDEILKQFAEELKANFRRNDSLGRFGGDEFIVAMDGDIDEAHSTLARVSRWLFGDYRIKTGGVSHKVTVKAATGIAAWDRTENTQTLLLRADKLMYRQKSNNGRRK
jgi:diguanylate cyclase